MHIPGAFYLSVKFDSRCHTEEGCDELQLASSADFQQDLHTFSGSFQKWTDIEIPGRLLQVLLEQKFIEQIVERFSYTPTTVRGILSLGPEKVPHSLKCKKSGTDAA